MLCTEIINVLVRERHVLNELDHMLKPCKHGIAALVGNRAEKKIKGDAHIAVILMKISVRHRHLVEIHHHRQISLIKLRHNSVPLSGRKKAA